MLKIHAPKSHPRYLSLLYRDMLADGVERGITSLQGLTAHGRGEAFDYLLGEKTHKFALDSIEAAAALFLLSKNPVLSVNGNTAVLVPEEFIKLSRLIKAKIEVNLFHASKKREEKIAKHLKKYGARKVLLPDRGKISGIDSNRRIVNVLGQESADVVFVPLEDGDRTEGLISMGKKVITVDLNPLSRSAQKASITIVDNIKRVMPLIISSVSKFKRKSKNFWLQKLASYDNTLVFKQAERTMRTLGKSRE